MAGQAAASSPAADANAAAQVQALQSFKESLTPTEQKIDSRLLLTMAQRSGNVVAAVTPKLKTHVAVSKAGTTVVDLTVSKTTAGLLARLRAAGATVQNAQAGGTIVEVAVPLGAVEKVAAFPDVRHVTVPMGYATANALSTTTPLQTATAASSKVASIRSTLATVLAPHARSKTVTSEGDATLAADTARATFHVSGTGVKVCVLSDGVDSLSDEQAKGELPAVDVLPGQDGEGDEGTAILEIVHDLAPNADLGFATVNPTQEQFAQNIRDLRFVAGCDIIVDDVIYFAEATMQDGIVAAAVNDVIADGGHYFSSAGNEGNNLDGTSGNYEGDFVDSGETVGKFRGHATDFDPGPGVQVYDPLSAFSSPGAPIILTWADPQGGANDDYDLYEFDDAGNVLAVSQDVQNGNDDPFEGFFGNDGSGPRIAVVKFRGNDVYFKVTAFRSRFVDSADGLTAFSTPGQTWGHSAARGAFSVAAAPAHDPLPFDLEPGDPPNPSGPFPNPFDATQLPERFTSDGPRRIFFNEDGSAITPGNFSSTGGEVRQKPEITSADGVVTGLDPDGPFNPFFGTSAAAPHAAAIAALVLSGNPGMTNDALRAAFESTAIDIVTPGVDDTTGHGIVRADLVLAQTGATPQNRISFKSGTLAKIVTGDGDQYLEPGETGSVKVTVSNTGDVDADNVTITVSTDDAGVTIKEPTKTVSSIAVGESRSKAFKVALADDYPIGKPVHLEVTVAFAGSLSPTTASFVVPTGQPAETATTFSYTGPPVAIPDDDPAGVSPTITVAGIGYASKVTFSIDGTDCTADEGATTVGIDHTFVGDLIGTLKAPDGSTATLFDRNGSGGNNLCQVVFDDAATTPFSTVESEDAPFTGTWQPETPLSALLGSSVDGTWTFNVSDNAGVDTGSVRAFSLHITGFVH
jgi:subtilisin-like proprotein convertase family protein